MPKGKRGAPLHMNIRVRIDHRRWQRPVTRALLQAWIVAASEGAPLPPGISVHAIDWKHGQEIEPSLLHPEPHKLRALGDFLAVLQSDKTIVNAVNIAKDEDIN